MRRCTAVVLLVGLLVMPAPGVTQTIVKGPYLQTVTPNSIKIFWETDTATSGSVHFGLASTDENIVVDPQAGTMHRVTLSGLTPNTAYQYRVSSDAASSNTYTFKTAGDRDTPFKLVLFGDNRYGSSSAWQLWDNDKVIAHMEAFAPDILVNTGDLTNDDDAGGWEALFTGHQALFAESTFYSAMGNHDRMPGMQQYLDNANRLQSSPDKIHHAARYNGIQFLFLGDEYEWSASEASWMQATIEQAEADGLYQTIVVMHYPPYNNSRHGNGGDDVLPILEGHDSVHFVFAGHSHNYQRNYAEGRTYLVSGGAGAGIYSEDREEPYNQVFAPVKHHVEIEVAGRNLDFRAIDTEGAVIDAFSFEVPLNPTDVGDDALDPGKREVYLRAFPNPFNPRVTVWLAPDEREPADPVDLRVFDVNGTALIKTVVSRGRLQEGHVLDLQPHPAGVYLLRAEVDGIKHVRKLHLVK